MPAARKTHLAQAGLRGTSLDVELDPQTMDFLKPAGFWLLALQLLVAQIYSLCAIASSVVIVQSRNTENCICYTTQTSCVSIYNSTAPLSRVYIRHECDRKSKNISWILKSVKP